MYTRYDYLAGATANNVVSDVAAIFGGETNKANLSAACDQANTTITSTVAAGWTIHDAAAGTGKIVLKSPHNKNAALYKYAMLDVVTNSSYLALYGYEYWNAASHTGTKLVGSSTDFRQRTVLSTGGSLYLFSSNRFMALIRNNGIVWGSDSYQADGGINLIVEYDSSNMPWHDVSMPDFAVIDSGRAFGRIFGENNFSNGYICACPCKAVNVHGDVVGGGMDYSSAMAMYAGVAQIYETSSSIRFPSGVNQRVPDGLGGNETPFLQFHLCGQRTYGIPMDVSQLCDIWLPPHNLVGNLETVTKGAADYIAVVAANKTYNPRFLFRKG